MRYRRLDSNGDFVFGQGVTEILVNSPEAVAQAVETRLRLSQGEWFLDQQEGTPYSSQILGTGTQALYDQAIRLRILGTPGVTSIIDYVSVLENRSLSVYAKIDTLYGAATISQVL